MGCVPCNQVEGKRVRTQSEDNKTKNPQNPNFNDLTDAASYSIKKSFS